MAASTGTTTAAASPPSTTRSGATPVATAGRIRNRQFPIPRFGDDLWDLSCVDHRPNISPFRLNFAKLPPHRRLAAKELLFQRLNTPVPSIRETRHPIALLPESCCKVLSHVTAVFAFLDREGIATIPEIGSAHLACFLNEITAGVEDPMRRYGLLKVFDMLRESRHHLSEGGLSFHPFPGLSLLHIAGVDKAEECATERIPEDAMRHLLFWALAYVDLFSPEILAAEAQRWTGPAKPPIRRSDAVAGDAAVGIRTERDDAGSRAVILDTYLSSLRTSGNGLPAHVWKGRTVPDTSIVAARAGIERPTEQDRRWIAGALRGCDLPLDPQHFWHPNARLPGATMPWRGALSKKTVLEECRRLQVAAYVVVAYLTGMRDSEVQTLVRGCVKLVKDERGEVFRRKISGLAYKGSAGRPRRRDWVVIDPVVRAVRVLEALTRHLHASQGEAYLFAALDHHDESMGLFGPRINKRLRDFASHCERVIAPRMRGADLPAAPVDGPFPFKPTHFRRTLAWHIANQPFGVVAGMIQYGHASVQMFEGYAGTSESGFAAEVTRDRAAGRLSDVVEMFDDEERGVRPAGPMAAELRSYFERKRRELREFPGEIADERRVRELLRQKASDLHVGRLVHCFYTADRARCQEQVPREERVSPRTHLCDPHCENACWAQKSLPAWKSTLEECRAMLKPNWIPTRQRESLVAQRVGIERIIGAIEAAGRGGLDVGG